MSGILWRSARQRNYSMADHLERRRMDSFKSPQSGETVERGPGKGEKLGDRPFEKAIFRTTASSQATAKKPGLGREQKIRRAKIDRLDFGRKFLKFPSPRSPWHRASQDFPPAAQARTKRSGTPEFSPQQHRPTLSDRASQHFPTGSTGPH